MFFAIFWSAFVPIGALIVSLISDWLIQSFRQLRPYAWPGRLEPRPLEPRPKERCDMNRRHKANLAALGLSLMLAVLTTPHSLQSSRASEAASASAQLAQYCMPSEEDGAPAQRIFC
jgi:hypothetical protein